MSTKLPADVRRSTTDSSSLLRLLVRRGFVENNVCLNHLIHVRLQLLNLSGAAQTNSTSPDGLEKRNLENLNAVNPVGLERVNHGV